MTVRRGLVVNARNDWPSDDELRALNPSVLRTIVYSNDELEWRLSEMKITIPVIALLNGEHMDVNHDWSRWEGMVKRFAQRFAGRLEAVEILNEWDLLAIPHDVVAQCVTVSSHHLKKAGMRRILGAVAGSNWANDLEAVVARTRHHIDAVALHPYGQAPEGIYQEPRFGNLKAAVMTAHERSGFPVVLTEMGVKLIDVTPDKSNEQLGEMGQAEYLRGAYRDLDSLPDGACESACYFAWSDTIGGPTERGMEAFGLRRVEGSARRAWAAFAKAAVGSGVENHDSIVTPGDSFWIGEGVRREISDRGWTPTDNEVYPTPGLSVVPCEEGIVFWLARSGKAKAIRWEDAA